MATFKISAPPERTGDTEVDVNRLYSYVDELYSQLKYVLYNIDEENLSESLLESESEE
jgi:hypothetical protein